MAAVRSPTTPSRPGPAVSVDASREPTRPGVSTRQCAHRTASATSSGLAPANSSISDSRTAVIEPTRASPKASRSTLVGGEGGEGGGQGGRQPGDAALGEHVVAQHGGVDVDRFGQRGLALEAGGPGGEQPGEQQVGVGLQVDALDLEVGRPRGASGRAGHHAQRGLAVLQPPRGVDAGPVLRHQAQVRRHPGRPDGQQPGEVVEDAGRERLALAGEPVPAVAAGHQVGVVAPDAEVDVPAVADTGGVDLRGERRAVPVPRPDRADRRPHQHGGVGGVDRGPGRHRELELPGGVLGVVLLDGHPLAPNAVRTSREYAEASTQRDTP